MKNRINYCGIDVSLRTHKVCLLDKNQEVIRETVVMPSFQVNDSIDKNLYYLHTFLKEKKFYLIVTVKYLNGEGFIITVFYSKNKKNER